MPNIYKCPVCGVELVQEYGHPICGTNKRIKHHIDVIHSMVYRTYPDSEYHTYEATSALRPYKDGMVYRDSHDCTGRWTGETSWKKL